MNLSVVIPVFNSAGTIPALLSRLDVTLHKIADSFEVILVNDGSLDNSWEIILQLYEKYPWIHGINLMRNYGQGNALLRGIHAAKYEVTVTMDDDLQNPPEDIPLLLAKLQEGYDVVYGYATSEGHVRQRTFTSRLIKKVMHVVVNAPGIEQSGPFRAFRTILREGFTGYKNPYVSIDVLLSWSTTKYAYVHVRHEQRKAGKSNYTFGKLITHTLNLLLGFSTLPLRLASFLGFALTFFGIGVFIYVVGRMLIFGSPVQGFTFLASIISIFSGVQLFSLGIIGEYLARMYVQMMSRPIYTVRSEIGKGLNND